MFTWNWLNLLWHETSPETSHASAEVSVLTMMLHRLNIDLPHVKQKVNWDCGLACCCMVLQKVLGNKYEKATFDDACASQGFGTSVWTIDIASILTEYNVDYMFFTKTLGADSSYQDNVFYEGSFGLDEIRVNRLFEMAPELKINVEKRSVSLDYILSHLVQGYVAIVLVNSNVLHCDRCGIGSTSPLAHMLAFCCCTSNKNYCGHFIVLCGFDKVTRHVFYKNPSFDEELCSVPFESFDFARKCYGTDEDIIFIQVTKGFSEEMIIS